MEVEGQEKVASCCMFTLLGFGAALTVLVVVVAVRLL